MKFPLSGYCDLCQEHFVPPVTDCCPAQLFCPELQTVCLLLKILPF